MSDDLDVKSCKVVLLGESGVGKTCIISRYTSNIFEDNGISTTGASYCAKTLSFEEYGGKTIKFEIWDTAGQEKFRAVNRLFYQNAAVCILVYDVTNRISFEAIKNFWVKDIKENIQKETSKIFYNIF